jgi:hypothetical protein
MLNKNFILLILTLSITVLLQANDTAKEQTIYLKSGDKITGTIQKVDNQAGEITILTKYGSLVIKQDEIMEEIASITLTSGDKLKGRILSKTEQTTDLLTDYGVLSITNSDIARIDYGLLDKNQKVAEIKDKFTLGNERQIDVFYDPTGYTLEKGVLYFSGLSWGFGFTDHFQITSRWVGYFTGDFNIRPKLQLFRFGTLENEHVFSIGAHIHTRYSPNKYEWIEKTYLFEKGNYDYSNYYSWVPTGDSIPVYYTGFYKVGTKIKLDNENRRYLEMDNILETPNVNTESPKAMEYYEVFAAYTISKARRNNTGRISHTFGAIAGKYPWKDDIMYKIYYAGGVDIRKNLIMNYEIFYDPYYVEWWNRGSEIFGIYDNLLTTTKQKKPYVSPIHFDIGFIFAISDWLRFGIHFQPYIFGIYLKF